MIRSRHDRVLPLLIVLIVLSGCQSAAGGGGGDQMRSTVYATHRLVQNMDRNLTAAVARLNETSAELVARIDASDRESRTLLSAVEENQVKLELLQRRLNEFMVTLYAHLELSPPTSLAGGFPREPAFAEEPFPAPSTPERPRVDVHLEKPRPLQGRSRGQARARPIVQEGWRKLRSWED